LQGGNIFFAENSNIVQILNHIGMAVAIGNGRDAV